MHSHDRTLLASLGFSDPDKKNRRHDYACQFLAKAENAVAIMHRLMGSRILTKEAFHRIDALVVAANNGDALSLRRLNEIWATYDTPPISPESVSLWRSAIEAPISKGEGQYKSTIGFADVLLDLNSKYLFVLRMSESFPEKAHWVSGRKKVLVEVKIHPVDVGAIIRQLNLYREHYHFDYTPDSETLAVCDFDLQPEDIATLRSERIQYLRLGTRFDAYVKEREQSPKQAVPDCLVL